MSGASRYRIVGRIGVGGMAEVFEAVAVGEQGFERRVALKRLLVAGGADSAAYQRMFLDEARIAAQLHHANIVGVVDYGLADGVPFQVLDYVDGIDVYAISELAKGPLPIAIALHLAIMVGHALDYAHTAVDVSGTPLGIVHRDVTPGNILVSWSGDVKLTDFGIAFAHVKAEHTLAGVTKGTPQYMASEQMLAEETDGRTDVFALGCVLHMMLTGWSPLEKDDQQFHLVSGGELQLAEGLPEDVRAIITRATRNARTARYANASEFVAALAQALAARAIVDPRSALRTWMRDLRAGAEASATLPSLGAIDGPLDLSLTSAPAAAADDVRWFQTIGTATRAERPAVRSNGARPDAGAAPVGVDLHGPAEAGSNVATDEGSRVAGSAPRRSRRGILIAILAVAVIVVLVVIVATPKAPAEGLARSPVAVSEPVPMARDAVIAADAAVSADGAVAIAQNVVPVGTSKQVATTNASARTSTATAMKATTTNTTNTTGKPTGPATPEATETSDATADAAEDARSHKQTQRWILHHRQAVDGFKAWVGANPAAAKLLRAWDGAHRGSSALVGWLLEHATATIADYVTAHPESGLGPVAAAVDLSGLASWAHEYDAQVSPLVYKQLGLPWVAVGAE